MGHKNGPLHRGPERKITQQAQETLLRKKKGKKKNTTYGCIRTMNFCITSILYCSAQTSDLNSDMGTGPKTCPKWGSGLDMGPIINLVPSPSM